MCSDFLVLCSVFLFCCSRRLCLGINTPVKCPRCPSHIHKTFLMVILFRSFTTFLVCYLDLLCSESDELELLLLVCFYFSSHVLVSALLGKNNNNKPQWLLLIWWVVDICDVFTGNCVLWCYEVSFGVMKCPLSCLTPLGLSSVGRYKMVIPGFLFGPTCCPSAHSFAQL